MLQHDPINSRKAVTSKAFSYTQNSTGKFAFSYTQNNNEQGKRPKPKGCPRCGSTGYLPQFRHILDGVCFSCMGTGSCVHPVYPKSTCERTSEAKCWYIGLWLSGEKYELLFSFTSESVAHAHKYAQSRLSEMSCEDEEKTARFKLVAGHIGEKKKDVMSRIQSFLQVPA